ncbi:MAG TPA: transcription antitermination factor NusB [Chitinophagales bacterium]|nr:transcription antitermination factor NusB [Chitinophagales bacterium]
MQYIYAYETTASAPASQFQNFLEKSILSVKDQYLYLLLCIREIANFVETDAKIKAGKHLKNDKDKNFSTKLLSNVLVQYLNNDKEFNIELKNASIASLLDDDNIRQLYKKLTESEAYVDYLTNGTEFNVEADKSIITFLLNNLILEDENFTTNMEELFTNWMDDAEFVVEAVHEVIQKSKNELKLHLEKGNLKDKFKELTQFGIDLFNETINNKKAHYKLIEPKLKNWETDRLAIIDVILIRMAVSEFLYFPSIPVKVTINEYLDIAKEYSTPKSKDFINGVLDSLMRDMKTNDQLNKTGRGLL